MPELDLTAAVLDAIGRAGVAGHVEVEQSAVPGVVRLTGQVVSEDEKLKADQAARSVEGVLDVIDEIRLSVRRAR